MSVSETSMDLETSHPKDHHHASQRVNEPLIRILGTRAKLLRGRVVPLNHSFVKRLLYNNKHTNLEKVAVAQMAIVFVSVLEVSSANHHSLIFEISCFFHFYF